jgi:murein DD-endopeptidase MepM/ murein hydrolase activator NlpD
LLNALGGVLRAIARQRPIDRDPSLTVRYLRRRTVRIARRLVDRMTPVPTRRPANIGPAPRHLATHRTASMTSGRRAPQPHGRLGLHLLSRLDRRLDRRLLKARLSSEHSLPIVVAFIVVLASVVSLAPGAVRSVGAAQPASQSVRLSVGGTSSADTADPLLGGAARTGSALGDYVDDGTFYKPVAVDTTVESGSSLLSHYTVRSGDTLTGIASHFGVSMMTLYWANHMTAKDSLKIGESLTVPPVNGLVVTVGVGDTLDALAAKYKVDAASILDLNGLTDPNLVVGQVLILPGAKGAPIPTASPTPTRRATTSSGSSSSGSSSSSASYTGKTPSYSGGAWAWPVVGGGNYISQYFHYGHLGIDIAATYGTPIVASLAGVVVFAGWKSNGGGYQVWISHGNNLYTMSCHMSGVTVSTGQSVGRGEQVGRVGMSGWATGPHDHFAVSIGYPWGGGSYFVNPLNYY